MPRRLPFPPTSLPSSPPWISPAVVLTVPPSHALPPAPSLPLHPSRLHSKKLAASSIPAASPAPRHSSEPAPQLRRAPPTLRLRVRRLTAGSVYCQRREDRQDLRVLLPFRQLALRHGTLPNRSAALASIHLYSDALADAEKTVELKPDWAKGYSRLGAAHLGLGDAASSIVAYEKGLALDPNNQGLKDGLADAKKAAAPPPPRRPPSGADAIGQMFQGPELWSKIAADPATRAYLEQPDFMQMLREVQRNPSSLNMYLSDPRMMQVLSLMLNIKIQRGEDSDLPQTSSPPPQPQQQKQEQPETKAREVEPEPEPEPMEVSDEEKERKEREAAAQKEKEAGRCLVRNLAARGLGSYLVAYEDSSRFSIGSAG